MAEFYISGLIHITELEKKENDEVKISLESLEENFLHFGFNKQGHSLSQGDIDISLQYNLIDYLDKEELSQFELDKIYEVLWSFDIKYSPPSEWSYDNEWNEDLIIEKLEIKISPLEIKEYEINDENNTLY